VLVRPAFASSNAAVRPAGPAPMMTTEGLESVLESVAVNVIPLSPRLTPILMEVDLRDGQLGDQFRR
jgi:hypothetical protein